MASDQDNLSDFSTENVDYLAHLEICAHPIEEDPKVMLNDGL